MNVGDFELEHLRRRVEGEMVMGFDGRQPGDNPALEKIERLEVELAAEREKVSNLHANIRLERRTVVRLREAAAGLLGCIGNLDVDRFQMNKIIELRAILKETGGEHE
jgi:hypothetical protein